jgi:hypothetical protein
MPDSGGSKLKNGLLVIALLVLSAQTSAPMSAAAPAAHWSRHLVYQFGYNTPVASAGNGTGTTTVTLSGPAADGGITISGQDSWWNTVRPRAVNTCELYAGGNVKCSQMPYAISPMQVTIFPLLAHSYYKSLNAAATSSWTHSYQLYAAIIPGASGLAGNPSTWNCSYNLQGKGPIKGAGNLVLIQGTGTLDQQGGTYMKATSKLRVVYDPAAKIPGIVRDVRTHIPMRSVYSNDTVELKLIKDSGVKH